MKVITKKQIIKILSDLKKKNKEITYDSISDELNFSRAYTIENCKDYIELIKEAKEKHLIRIAKEIAKKNKGKFIKVEDKHNRLYTFKCNEEDHPLFTVQLGLAKRWCRYCADKRGMWLKKIKKKDLSNLTASEIFKNMGGHEHFKNVMALSWTLRKLRIKIKDTSTSAKIYKELKNLDYSSIPGITDFIKDLKSKDLSNLTITDLYMNHNGKLYFNEEVKFENFFKSLNLKVLDDSDVEKYITYLIEKPNEPFVPKTTNISVVELNKRLEERADLYSTMTISEIFESLDDDEKFYIKTEDFLMFYVRQYKIKTKESELLQKIKDKSAIYSNMTINEIFNSLNDEERFYIKNEKMLSSYFKSLRIKTKESQ